jgi:hypothetical protein
MVERAAVWTSLEVVKLIISVMTPVAVLVLGIFVKRATSRIERIQWASQTVIEYRLKVFEGIAPKLNRLLCFYTFVGRWKELTPADVVELKRELDEDVHVNRMLFSPAFFDAYQEFMELLFETYAARDRDAPIRALVKSEFGDRRSLDSWVPAYEAWFAQVGIPSLVDVKAAYERLGDRLRVELYIPMAVAEVG